MACAWAQGHVCIGQQHLLRTYIICTAWASSHNLFRVAHGLLLSRVCVCKQVNRWAKRWPMPLRPTSMPLRRQSLALLQSRLQSRCATVYTHEQHFWLQRGTKHSYCQMSCARE